MSGDYARVEGLKSGDVMTVEFPMREKTLFKVIGEIPYKLTLKGNTVVDMESNLTLSPGPKVDFVTELGHERAEPLLKEELAPLYQREKYRAGKAATKRVTRFVPRETIRW